MIRHQHACTFIKNQNATCTKLSFICSFFFNSASRCVLNYKERTKQIAIEHNLLIKYSNSYMFWLRGVIIRLAFRTHGKEYTYRISLFVVRSLTCFSQISWHLQGVKCSDVSTKFKFMKNWSVLNFLYEMPDDYSVGIEKVAM